jgi:hypothetical protein
VDLLEWWRSRPISRIELGAFRKNSGRIVGRPGK